MSITRKDTIQKILLIALGAMTVSMILISMFNYKDNRQKNEYLEKEMVLIQEELSEIAKNYDHLSKISAEDIKEVKAEQVKVKTLLDDIRHTILDYDTIIQYRKQMLELRKSNQNIRRRLETGMSSGTMNTNY